MVHVDKPDEKLCYQAIFQRWIAQGININFEDYLQMKILIALVVWIMLAGAFLAIFAINRNEDDEG